MTSAATRPLAGGAAAAVAGKVAEATGATAWVGAAGAMAVGGEAGATVELTTGVTLGILVAVGGGTVGGTVARCVGDAVGAGTVADGAIATWTGVAVSRGLVLSVI